MALRIRPLNEAEIEEGAAVVAQRVDDQVGFVKLVHRGNRCIGKCCVTETDRYLKTNSFTKQIYTWDCHASREGVAYTPWSYVPVFTPGSAVRDSHIMLVEQHRNNTV